MRTFPCRFKDIVSIKNNHNKQLGYRMAAILRRLGCAKAPVVGEKDSRGVELGFMVSDLLP